MSIPVFFFNRDNQNTFNKFYRLFLMKNLYVFAGSYFARDAKYSHSYTSGSGTRTMFVCRVLVGCYTKGNSGYLRPPPKAGEDAVFYDSCVDDVRDPSIFVVFEKHQVYPEYILKYDEEAWLPPAATVTVSSLGLNSTPAGFAGATGIANPVGVRHLVSAGSLYQKPVQAPPPVITSPVIPKPVQAPPPVITRPVIPKPVQAPPPVITRPLTPMPVQAPPPVITRPVIPKPVQAPPPVITRPVIPKPVQPLFPVQASSVTPEPMKIDTGSDWVKNFDIEDFEPFPWPILPSDSREDVSSTTATVGSSRSHSGSSRSHSGSSYRAGSYAQPSAFSSASYHVNGRSPGAASGTSSPTNASSLSGSARFSRSSPNVAKNPKDKDCTIL